MSDFPDLNTAVRDIWDANAGFWNARMGEGNDFHTILIAPAQERLLALKPGEAVLDVGCGNGQFARRMTQLGARVLGVDVSPRMIEIARVSSAAVSGELEFQVVDATDPNALTMLGRRRFDAVVCTMALMDIAAIDPLMASIADVMRPDGRFVFSVVHPCFNSSRVRLVAEEETTDGGQLVRRYSVKLSEYIRSKPGKGVAMRGQPVAQYYFDRPISALFNSAFKAGFVLDGLEEPTFPESADDGRANWSNMTEIPPALVARLRLLAMAQR